MSTPSVDPPQPRRSGALAIVVVGGAGISLAMLSPRRSPAMFVVILATAVGGIVAFLRARARDATAPSARALVLVSAALLVVAVAVPPRGSKDLWSYAMYGRIVSHHHANPYEVVPAAFPADPFLTRVRPNFADDPSVYGPVFTGISAAITWIAGDDPLAVRVGFQALAALTVLAALAIVARRTKDAGAVALLGLHPVTAAIVVNGGHNDPLVGLAALAGGALASTHPAAAGAVLALGAGVKVVGVLPLAAVACWSWVRRGVRPALTLAAAGAAMLTLPYAAAGGTTAVEPLRSASRLVSRHVVWRAFGSSGTAWIATAGIVVVLVLTAVQILPRLSTDDADRIAGVSTVPYLIAAPYVLPWYAWWALPPLARSWRTPMTWLVSAQALYLMVVYPQRRAGSDAIADTVLRWLRTGVGLAAHVVVVAVLLTGGAIGIVRRRRGRTAQTSEAETR